jgi:hypothetical protein
MIDGILQLGDSPEKLYARQSRAPDEPFVRADKAFVRAKRTYTALACDRRTDPSDGAEAGRNLGHSFAAASFGSDDSLAADCDEEEHEEHEEEIRQIQGFHVSVTSNGKVSSSGISNTSGESSGGSNRTTAGKRRPSAHTSSIRRMADSATSPTISSAEKFKGAPSSVVKPVRARRRPLKQQNSNGNVSVVSGADGIRSRPALASGSVTLSTQQTSRRNSGGRGRKAGQVPTPEKPKLRRKSPRKATAAASNGPGGSAAITLKDKEGQQLTR